MGKQLVIAEKSSAGKDIARVLGLKASDMENGFMENDKYIVSWARGHLIGLKEPVEIYGEKEAWDLDKLPFKINVETNLKIITEKGANAIFTTLQALINRPDVDFIINAGDSGREGELIQQWIYKMAGNKKPIKRLWVSSLTDESIKKAFNNLKKNDDYKNLYEEGKALKVIDYMYGMSYTVLLTKLYSEKDTLHYGRCQTPLLNLIVERENEIKNFVKEKYNLLQSDFITYKGTKLKLDEETKKYVNDTLKFANEEEKKNYLENWKQYKEGIIKEYKAENKEKKAPRCFSMSSLQQALGKKYGFTPDHTLKLAQSLYEKKYTTYPRTNSEYLSTDIWNEKEKHIQSSIYCLYFVKEFVGKIDKNKALSKDYVDNSKIEDHHAIIPTDIKADIFSLNEDEKIAYIEICKRFISIFMEPYKYKATTIITEINKEYFKTVGTQEISKGYKELYSKDAEDEEKKKDADEEEYSNLPTLKEGDKVEIYNYSLKEGETKPKSRFNVGNITDIMDKYGIGTQATQASIIENILNQRVIEIISKGKKKEYAPTDKGMNLIKLVPDNLKTSDLSKRVEERIKEIGKGKLSLKTLQDDIYKEQIEVINTLKENQKTNPISFSFTKPEKKIIGKCPFCGKDMIINNSGNLSHIDWQDNQCKFTIWKSSLYTTFNEKMMKDLLTNGKTIGNFKSKAGKTYKQEIILNRNTTDLEKALIKGEYINDIKKDNKVYKVRVNKNGNYNMKDVNKYFNNIMKNIMEDNI